MPKNLFEVYEVERKWIKWEKREWSLYNIISDAKSDTTCNSLCSDTTPHTTYNSMMYNCVPIIELKCGWRDLRKVNYDVTNFSV